MQMIDLSGKFFLFINKILKRYTLLQFASLFHNSDLAVIIKIKAKLGKNDF
jgi:hypothetical protein